MRHTENVGDDALGEVRLLCYPDHFQPSLVLPRVQRVQVGFDALQLGDPRGHLVVAEQDPPAHFELPANSYSAAMVTRTEC